jgi:hypothetical protein
MKFKATIEVTYDVDPEHYGNGTVDEMLAIDRESFEADPHMLLDIGEFTVKIEEAD